MVAPLNNVNHATMAQIGNSLRQTVFEMLDVDV